jgi:hypothetical protein
MKLALALAALVSVAAAPSVAIKWCYSSTTCSAGCVSWVAADGTCYAGLNGQPAARIYVNTTFSPPREGYLISYTSSADCTGTTASAVVLPLDGTCQVVAGATQSFTAANSGVGGAMAGALSVLFFAITLVKLVME